MMAPCIELCESDGFAVDNDTLAQLEQLLYEAFLPAPYLEVDNQEKEGNFSDSDSC